MSIKKIQKIISVLALTILVTPIFYNPITAPKVEAGLPVIDWPQLIQKGLDIVAQIIAKDLSDNIVKSTIRWANTGFDGNPAYVTDPEGFFRNTASGALGDLIASDSNLGFLCSPFQAQIKLSLVRQYVEPETQYQCTIEQIGGNFENFVNNFDEGGWDAWFAVSQSEAGNPYGAFLKAKLDTDQRIQNLIGLKKDELEVNTGFLNKTTCEGIRNPAVPTRDRIDYENGNITPQVQTLLDQGWDPNKSVGACLGREVTVTPGAQIRNALDGTIASGFNRLIDVDSFDQLVGAFATGLLDRYVLGDRGLFGSRFNDHFSASSQSAKVPRARFGWVPCAKEGEICVFDGAEKVKMGYSSIAQKIIEDVEGEISCDRETFDFPEKGSGGSYKKQQLVNRDQECYFYGQTSGPYSPSGDEDIWISCAEQGGVCRFEGKKQVRYGAGFLYYLKLVNEEISCTNSAFGGNPTQFDDPSRAKSCQYRSPSPSSIIPAIPPTSGVPTLSCSPSKTTADRFENVVWTANSTYPAGTTYSWTGSEISSTSFGALTNITQSYYSPGIKTASITIRQPGLADISTTCTGSVNVVVGIGGGIPF